MSSIFSSNGNNYTFKKLDNMLINMPEKDGHHVLIETVDGVPQYSWGSTPSYIVKANEAFVFEYTPETTESFNGEWGGDGMPPMPSGSYLITTTVITYLPDDMFNDCTSIESVVEKTVITYLPEDMFNDCTSIESVVEKGYRVLVTFDNTPILDRPYIDTLNSLVSHTGYAVVNIGGNEGARSAPGGSRASPYNSPVLRTFSNLPLMLLGGVKSITIVFEHLGEVVASSSSGSS